jgi:hypothetical protein
MYKYYNAEPDGESLSDCVIRAICTALDLPYYDVVDMLSNNGSFRDCDAICVDCYGKLLTHNLRLPHYIGDNAPVQQIADDFSDSVVLIRIQGHLTCSIYGKIYDTWDCTNKPCTDFWVVK